MGGTRRLVADRLDILVLGPDRAASRATARDLLCQGFRAAGGGSRGPAGWAATALRAQPRIVLHDLPRGSRVPATMPQAVLRRLRAREAKAAQGAPGLPVVLRCATAGAAGIRALLAAGASDVMGTDAPDELLVLRLRTQLLVQRQRGEIERRLRHEKAVAACARLLVGGGDLPAQLEQVVSLLREATGASRAYLFRTEADAAPGLVFSQVHEACAPGVAPQLGNPALRRMPLLAAAPNAAKALAEGRTFAGIVAEMEEPERGLLASQGVLSIVILPVFRGAEFWGFIGFDDCERGVAWSPDDVTLLKVVAEATGLAVERVHAEGEIYRFAEQDSLTGLHNRRYMLDRLAQLASQAARGDVRFALALVDVDFFKRVNDTHGHAAGDQVLQRFAASLHQHFRPYDLVGRHGGEEFLVVMLNAGAAQLAGRLDALRLSLAAQPFRHEDLELVVRFSAGVAGSDEAAGKDMVRALLEAADKRLYQAKRAGRDRVVATARARRRRGP
ncbi:MAG: diguanylate cyclase [Alphaproteobacteria bacterium]